MANGKTGGFVKWKKILKGNRKDLDVQLYAVQYFDEERIPLPGSFIRTSGRAI